MGGFLAVLMHKRHLRFYFSIAAIGQSVEFGYCWCYGHVLSSDDAGWGDDIHWELHCVWDN